jgi:hypothetical protein
MCRPQSGAARTLVLASGLSPRAERPSHAENTTAPVRAARGQRGCHPVLIVAGTATSSAQGAARAAPRRRRCGGCGWRRPRHVPTGTTCRAQP